MTQTVVWEPLERNYFLEKRSHRLPVQRCEPGGHPLALPFQRRRGKERKEEKGEEKIDEQPNIEEESDDNPLTLEPVVDPLLSEMGFSIAVDPLAEDGDMVPVTVDPLTEIDIKLSKRLSLGLPTTAASEGDLKGFTPWKAKRAGILKKYTTNTKIPVSADFLDSELKESTDDQKMRERAEDFSENTDEMLMNQKDYIKKMEDNNKRLIKAWADGKRVVALKIAIQSAKILNNTNIPQFYPSMFTLVSDILDSFGKLVFQRLKKKSETNGPLHDDFTNSDVGIDGRETCYNWFYKIACIRELLPRMMIELALSPCWRFIKQPHELPSIVNRLSMICRGIGNPLVAVYTRTYLSSKSSQITPRQFPELLVETFDDQLYIFKALDKKGFDKVKPVRQKKIAEMDYIDLFSPALEFIMQCVGFNCTEKTFFSLLQHYKDGWNNAVVLVHMLSQFPNKYISKHAKGIAKLCREANDTTLPRSRLYRELGKACVAEAPKEEDRLSLLNDVWKVVTKIESGEEYVLVASVWVEYLLQHFSHKETNTMLRDVVKHIKRDSCFKTLQNELYEMVEVILKYVQDFEALFAMTNFLPLIDMLERKNKMEACKLILVNFEREAMEADEGISDPMLIHSLFDVSRWLHDSVDFLTFEGERRHIAELIILFIDKLDFGNDLEKQLNYYVDFRGAFSNLDMVIHHLVLRVADVAMKAHRIMKGKHNKKTADFVKACLAFCHITIPGLESVFPKMNLFLTLGQIALLNKMVVEGEAFLKAAIHLVPHLPATMMSSRNTNQSTSTQLVQYVRNFCSTLLLLPGHPEHGPFHLVKGLKNALAEYETWKGGHVDHGRAWFSLLALFCAYAQSSFLYCVPGVDSNDKMYGGSPKYFQELSETIVELMDEIFQILADIGKRETEFAKLQQSNLALELVNFLLGNMKMTEECGKVIKRLFGIGLKSPEVEEHFLESTVRFIENMDGPAARASAYRYTAVAQKMREMKDKADEERAERQRKKDAEVERALDKAARGRKKKKKKKKEEKEKDKDKLAKN